MTRRTVCHVRAGALFLGLLATGCGTGPHDDSLVVGSDDGSGGAFSGVDASVSGLDAYIEEGHVKVTIVTLSCPGDCATVQAVGTGGNPPYTFAWDDGSTNATRQVCPTSNATYRVTVTDTGTSGEIARPPETAAASLAASLLTCPDAGAGGIGACPADAGVTDGGNVTPDYLDNAVAYFDDGGALPPGHYSLSYVSGCVKYNGYSNFTINGASNYEYWLVGAGTADPIAVAPGTVAVGLPFGYGDIASCEAANQALAPLDFDFDGGPLGMYLNDFQPSDNVIDPQSGAPTWRLSGSCR
jgi:hypothetical protein